MAFTPVPVDQRDILSSFMGPEGQRLFVERAWTTDDQIISVDRIQRIQIATEEGRVIAYTPTRVSAVPLCLSAAYCWVFMWKTVYPLPAIFRFDVNRDHWTNHPHPPMRYSRSGNDGEGFIKRTNPLWGFVGVFLLVLNKWQYFLLLGAASALLFVQINKFRDLPEMQKLWVRRILIVITAPLPIPFMPVEPFMLTAAAILAGSWYSIEKFGVPSVLSMLMCIFVFYCCSMIVTRMKKRRR
ncbi:MAG TPA: hypothetical protein VGD95_06090 [Micavibrio sp.]